MSSDDQKRKSDLRQKFLQSFDQQAAKSRDAQEKIERQKKAERQAENLAFEQRGAAGVAEEQKSLEKRKEDREQWRKNEAEMKLSIERDRQRKAEEETYQKELKAKEKAFNEKKKQYLGSLHESAIKKAKEDRAELEANQQLEKDLDSADRDARDARSRAEQECTAKKNQIERERLAERDRLERSHEQELAALHAESLRRPPSAATQRELEKKRRELDARYAADREAINQKALRDRANAESTLARTLLEIGSAKAQRRAGLKTEREQKKRA